MPTAKFITTVDFEKEPVQIAKNEYTTASLQGFIDEYEYHYLREMLGDDLLTRFFGDLSGSTPQHPKFTALLNGTTYKNADGKSVIYEGLKRALQYFIWVEYVNKSQYKNTISGQVEGQNENSTILIGGKISRLCASAWNKGWSYAMSVHRFVQYFEFYDATATSIALDSGITYTVLIPDTLFLKNGDTVKINGIDYVIANLVANTSFEIDSATNITGTNVQIDWTVFDEFDVEPMEVSFMNM